jgi:large subunit ribosomal protein L15
MRLADIRPQEGSTQRRRRLGRGVSAGQGASCGKGMRGQKARKGGSTRPGFEGGQMPLYRRVPKLKHFPIINRIDYTEVNLKSLLKLPAETHVTLESLIEAKIVTTNDGPLKILGDLEEADFTIKLTIEAAAVTQSAREKIEAAGGSITLIPKPKRQKAKESQDPEAKDPES